MKKLLFLLSISFAQMVMGQKTEVKNIPYYPAIEAKDPYISSQCKLDVYLPKKASSLPVIVWFHGGGLTGGTKEIPEELKSDQYIIVSVEYRLSPGVKAPAYIEDAATAVAWVFNNIAQYGGDTNKVFLSGHSAGGYLSMMLTMDPTWLSKRNISVTRIRATIPLSPQVITHYTIRAETKINELQPVISQYAPINFIKASSPVIIDITGDREMELYGRYEENAYFIRMMKLAGNKRVSLHELQGFGHGAMLLPGIHLLFQEADKLLAEKQ